MSYFFTYLLMLTLVANEAYAITPAQPAGASCRAQNPLAQVLTPLAPPAVPEGAATLSDTTQFAQCARFRANPGAGQNSCDQTLIKIYNEFTTIRRDYDTACNDTINMPTGCNLNNQATATSCAAGVAQRAQSTFTTFANRQRTTSQQLQTRTETNQREAAAILQARARAPRTPATIQTDIRELVQAGVQRLQNSSARNEASASLTECIRRINSQPACDLLGAAIEARYYSERLRSASEVTAEKATAAGRLAQAGTDAARRSGTVQDRERAAGTRSGSFLSGLGINDAIGLGTLGIVGATAFCGLTGKCTNQNSNDSTNPSGNPAGNASSLAEPGATSPTPSSANDPGASTNFGAGGLGTGASSSVATEEAGNTEGSLAGKAEEGFPAASFSGDDLQKNAFKPQDRAPASTQNASSKAENGSGASGSFGSGFSMKQDAEGSSVPATGAKAESSMPLAAGGGLASSGGFSLAPAGSGSPADSALRNILNGDVAPGSLDKALSGNSLDFSGIGSGGPSQGSTSTEESADSVFARVRDTHQRCLKRGCVGFEIGKRI